MISILLVDDHKIVRSGLKLLINNQPDMKVKYEADNGEDGVKIALDKEPDIVIMDLNMPDKSGLLSIQQIHEANQQIKIIVLTMHEDKQYILRSLQAGASSYLLKSQHENDLIDAIRYVYQGEAYLYPSATRYLLEEFFES